MSKDWQPVMDSKKTVMKKIIGGLIAALFISCVTTNQAETGDGYPEQAETGTVYLDHAIEQAAVYFAGGLPDGTRIAITAVDALTSVLSDYVIQELWTALQETDKFTMIDRRNSALVDNEIFYQLSGVVPDEEAEHLGNFLKADIIIYGNLLPFGDQYRLLLYATQPGRSTSLQQAISIAQLDDRFLPEKNLDAAVERAVAELGKSLTARTRVTIDRIGYQGYGTVSELSKYLAGTIIHQAARQPLYQVVEDGTAVGAYIKGSFYPQNEGVAVVLSLVSSYDSSYLGTSKFLIPPEEIDKLNLSMLPPNTSLSDLERVNRAIEPYRGGNNRFAFTVKSEKPDALYYDGDRLTFTVYAEEDCFFKITHIDVHGKQQVLFPVEEDDDNFIKAGQTRRIPPNRSFTIELHEPFGVEYILAAAYSEQFAFSVDTVENDVEVSAETVKNGLAVKGATRIQAKSGTVSIDTTLIPVATTHFSYTILP